MNRERRITATELWHRVTQSDVPIDVAPMVRDVLRAERMYSELRARRTVERIRAAIGEVPTPIIRSELVAILDEEAAR